MSLPRPIITLDNPDKPFYPCDEVTGTIQLNLLEPLEARSIFISSRGKTVVHSISPFEKPHVTCYFSKTQLVWVPKEGKTTIPADCHQFKFTILLPYDCLPTFRGPMGKTNYKIKISIDRPRKLNINAEGEFIVSKRLDIPRRLSPSLPANWFFNVNLPTGVIFSDGPVTLMVTTPSLVMSPGATLPLQFEVTNSSRTVVTHIYAKLFQRTHYHARPQKHVCEEFNNNCPLSCFMQQNTKEKIGCTEKHEVNLAPFTKGAYPVPFQVPEDLRVPSFNSGLISHGYFMEFGFRAKGAIDRAMICSFYLGEMEDYGGEESEELGGEVEEDAPPTYAEVVQN